MKFTLSWLKDHLDTDADLERLTTALTALGLEVEDVTDPGRALAAFRIARVTACEQHPDADRLRVCRVDYGRGDQVQVVCGAPNARADMIGVFAPSGTVVPGTGMTLKPSKIRGVESNGMLLSERELGLSDAHEGIVDLPVDAPVGTPYADYAGLNDPLIEIGLTPDRADCAGVRGIARDLAAAGFGTLKPMVGDAVAATAGPCPVGVTIAPEMKEAVPVFALRRIRGVANGESPQWLKDKLRSVGLRPISTLVDITNFFTMDQARPLHVFDAGKVKGNLVLRPARAGETLDALNDRSYRLADGMTAIADDSGVVSLAGIVGGTATAVDEQSTDILLECALFDPAATARTGQALQINSDARYRFERGVDPETVLPGIEDATRMILDLCGGEASETMIAGDVPDLRRTITLRSDRTATLGGCDVPADQQADVLRRLGFDVRPASVNGLTVTTPSWRRDVVGEADLVEEVLRVTGYDQIPVVPLPRPHVITRPALSEGQRRIARVRRMLATRGLFEAVTWSFMGERDARLFGFDDEAMRLVNPISADLDVMRPSVVGNLVRAAAKNIDRGQENPALFEVGPLFRDASDAGQIQTATTLRAGHTGPRHWAATPRAVDAFDAKADAIAVLTLLDAPVANLQVSADAPSWYHPGRSGCLRLGPTVLAHFGELHPSVAAALDIEGPVAASETFVDSVPAPKRKQQGAARPPVAMSAYQPVDRDLAFVVDADVPAEKIVRAARAADKVLITDVGIFDVYQGDRLEPGQKSVAITVRLQPTQATLTEKEIEAASDKIVAAVTKQTGGRLRS
ncbi:phenylalanine--tRNA ligase subunit beta [Fodinicurvata sp. EGI_FJ10296]|uniref:phenylalanine--tRNA ligase subunit beta n=1 Tax=Fodinicurvata sp. EGI_FJ10296 TaxID=3231908 RepID=UPI003455F382